MSRRTRANHPESCLFSPTGPSPSMVWLSRPIRLTAAFVTPFRHWTIRNMIAHNPGSATRPGLHTTGLGYFPFAHRYSGKSLLLSIPGGTKMFQFSPFASRKLCIHLRDDLPVTAAGLPHSGIFGSTVICTSPKLIAAYHALHRLLTPRHPPCALSNLT